MVSFFVKLVCEVVENRCDYDDGRKLLVQAAALQAPKERPNERGLIIGA